MIRPIKRMWCWIVGHKHQAAGHYSMCWRCGHIKHLPNPTDLKESQVPEDNPLKSCE